MPSFKMILNNTNSASIALKNYKTEKIKLLHKFIFDDNGNRGFHGFDFSIDNDEFKK